MFLHQWIQTKPTAHENQSVNMLKLDCASGLCFFFVGLPKARLQICREICMFSGADYLFDTFLYLSNVDFLL